MNAHVKIATRICAKCNQGDAAIARCDEAACGPHLTPETFYVASEPAGADFWRPACGGTEVPFRTRTGRLLLYCWLPSKHLHRYLDCETDMILSDEEANAALAMN